MNNLQVTDSVTVKGDTWKAEAVHGELVITKNDVVVDYPCTIKVHSKTRVLGVRKINSMYFAVAMPTYIYVVAYNNEVVHKFSTVYASTVVDLRVLDGKLLFIYRADKTRRFRINVGIAKGLDIASITGSRTKDDMLFPMGMSLAYAVEQYRKEFPLK